MTNQNDMLVRYAQKGVNLTSFGTCIKLLFTGYLVTIAVGYLMAIIQIMMTHGMADGKMGLSVEDVVYSYYGNRSNSVLESKLNGSMKGNASNEERSSIIQWVRNGASESEYAFHVKGIIDNKCVVCHNANSGTLQDFSKLENLKKVSESGEGASFQLLTRMSHIHLFGISFIFMFVGIIFSFSTNIPGRYKYPAVIMPYVFLLIDIASWWLTKLNPHFAWLVIIGGIGLAFSFVFMWTVSMYQMWVLGGIYKKSDRRNAIFRD